MPHNPKVYPDIKEVTDMSYKTILIHLNDPRRAAALLEPAIQLAKRYMLIS